MSKQKKPAVTTYAELEASLKEDILLAGMKIRLAVSEELQHMSGSESRMHFLKSPGFRVDGFRKDSIAYVDQDGEIMPFSTIEQDILFKMIENVGLVHILKKARKR